MDRPRPTIHSGERSGRDVLRQRACTAIGHCAQASPTVLPALTAALVEYLIAWRDALPDALPDQMSAGASVDPPRLRERGMVLAALIGRVEQMRDRSSDATAAPERWGRIADEAADILARVRRVVGALPQDRPDAHRLRLAVVEAWGRYDDALTEVRARDGDVVDTDLTVLGSLRDALLQHLDAARSLLGGPTIPADDSRRPGPAVLAEAGPPAPVAGRRAVDPEAVRPGWDQPG